MQQHHDAAVRLRRRHVHISHPQLLAVIDERQQVDGIGVRKTFEVDAVGLALGGLGGKGSGAWREQKEGG